MIPYRDKQRHYEGSRFASPSIGIGHAPVVGGWYNGVQVPPDDSCIPQHVINSCNRWYIGHIHTPAVITDTPVIIPGAVVQSSLADCGQDRFVWLQGKATDAPVPIKLIKGWTFEKIDLDFVNDKAKSMDVYNQLLTRPAATTVCSVQIRIALEDLGTVDLEKLKLALKNKIVDIPAPIIVRRMDSRVASVKLETPREEAVNQFIDATMPADKAARLKEKAKQLMGALK
jgi:DNA repair exonuclease SbcCD nuclease subunit